MRCRCGWWLIDTSHFRGGVEIKCPKCRYITSTGPATREVRCIGSFKGRRSLGGRCGQLVCRITHDASGSLTYRCPRCGSNKTLSFTQRALAST